MASPYGPPIIPSSAGPALTYTGPAIPVRFVAPAPGPTTPTAYSSAPSMDLKLTTVWVGRIATGVDDEMMKDMLKCCGEVASWKRMPDPETGRPKGFGYCQFVSPAGVDTVQVLLHDLEVGAQRLQVKADAQALRNTADFLSRMTPEEREEHNKLIHDAKERIAAIVAERNPAADIHTVLVSRELARFRDAPTSRDEALRKEREAREREAERERRREEERKAAEERQYRERERALERKQHETEQERNRWIAALREREVVSQRKFLELQQFDLQYNAEEEDRYRRSRRDRKIYREKEEREDAQDRKMEQDELERRRRDDEARAVQMQLETERQATLMESSITDPSPTPQPFSSTGFMGLVPRPGPAPQLYQQLSPGTSPTRDDHESRAGKRGLGIFGNARDDDEVLQPRKKLVLNPIEYTAEEKEAVAPLMKKREIQSLKQLIDRLPTERAEVYAWSINWAAMDAANILETKVRPFVNKKLVEVLGTDKGLLGDRIMQKLKAHSAASQVIELVSVMLEPQAADDFVLRLWRFVMFEQERMNLEQSKEQ
eukprot:TRINITY_DN14674_c0_g1_i1.p1 TRINITY_DN14674_c0_g1~~TRINITY_DN14674_c0_g1_i1.p1  ORF type:complete len:558 (-),score=108.51 TRINITY_DN14674_c0_g1_i1:1016-2656(-)